MTRFAQKTWRKVGVDLKPDVSDSSLWLGWSLKHTQSGVIPDASGNGRNGNVTFASRFSPLLGTGYETLKSDPNKVRGLSTKPTTHALPASVTTSFWYYPKHSAPAGRRYWLFNLYVSTLSEWGVAQNLQTIQIYDDLSNADSLRYTTSIPIKPIHLVITFDGATRENRLYIDAHLAGSGSISASGLNGLTAEAVFLSITTDFASRANGGVVAPQIFSEVKDQTWVTAEYQKGAKAIQFATDWGHKADGIARSGNDYIGDGPFRITSTSVGVTTCSMSTINSKDVKTITAGAGVNRIFAPWSNFGVQGAETGYGSWACWVFLPAVYTYWNWGLFTGDEPVSSAPGYRVDITAATGLMRIVQNGVGVVLSTADFPVNSWFYLHVDRRYDGRWELFVNGSSKASATNNNVASGKYTGFEFSGAGTAVALADPAGGHAITKYLGVVPPNLG